MANTSTTEPTITGQFAALGTSVEFGVRADATASQTLIADIICRVNAFEATFTRFHKSSELSTLNARAGQPTRVSQAMLALLLAARRVWLQTGGIVDPTIGSALNRAGYDQSFDQLVVDNPLPPAGEPVPDVTFGDVTVNQETSTVTMPAGSSLDLGGVGKGYLADQLVPIIEAVTHDYWLSLGGDMVGSGVGDDGKPWPIAVQNPQSMAHDLGTLRLPDTHWAMATSGISKRRGTRAGKAWHHLIDPRTGKPADTDVVGVTLVAPTALEADAFAKTVLLLGTGEGMAWLRRQSGCHAIVSTVHGFTISDTLKAYFTQA